MGSISLLRHLSARQYDMNLGTDEALSVKINLWKELCFNIIPYTKMKHKQININSDKLFRLNVQSYI